MINYFLEILKKFYLYFIKEYILLISQFGLIILHLLSFEYTNFAKDSSPEKTLALALIICGSLIGVLGTISGLILGTLFSYYLPDLQVLIEESLNRELWNPELRFLTEVPVRIRIIDLSYISFVSLTLSIIVTIFPAINAARLDPVEALKHE